MPTIIVVIHHFTPGSGQCKKTKIIIIIVNIRKEERKLSLFVDYNVNLENRRDQLKN